MRGPRRRHAADRRHSPASRPVGCGRHRRADRQRQGAGRARDADRPRTQRPRPPLRGGHRAGGRIHGRRELRSRASYRVERQRAAARGRRAGRRRSRAVPGRHDHRLPEGALHAADRRSRGTGTRRLHRRHGLPRARRQPRPQHPHPHDGRPGRRRSNCAPVPASSRTRTPSANSRKRARRRGACCAPSAARNDAHPRQRTRRRRPSIRSIAACTMATACSRRLRSWAGARASSTGTSSAWAAVPARLASRCRISTPCARTLRSSRRNPRCVVKLVLTRGAGERGYRPPRDPQPTRIVAAATGRPGRAMRPRRACGSDGAARASAGTRALAGLKHLNRLEQVLARAEWDDGAMDEGLMQDDRGRVIAATTGQCLCAHRRRAGCTPRLDECGVAGVMRRAFRQWPAEQGTPVVERDARSRGRRSGDLPPPDELADRRLAGRDAGRPRARDRSRGPGNSTHGSRAVNRWRAVRGACSRLLAVAWFLGWRQYERQLARASRSPRSSSRPIFEVPRGASLKSVARRLEEARTAWSVPATWARHAKRERLATRIKAGEYRLQPGTSPAMLLDAVRRGRRHPARADDARGLDLSPGAGGDPVASAGRSRTRRGCRMPRSGAARASRERASGRPVLSGHLSISARHDRPRTPASGPCAPRDASWPRHGAARRRTCRSTRLTRR